MRRRTPTARTLAEADADWSLLYNALPNEELGLNLIPSSILALWTGAALENATLQQNIIDEVFTYANATQSGNPFPDLYDPTGTTSFDEFEARPVQGGMFAPLVAVPAAK